MVFPMFSFVMPSFFSTPSSTGNPCVSHPAFRSTRNPCKVLYLQIISLIVLAITWWIPGIPFAEGGPSKKTNEGCPSLFFKLARRYCLIPTLSRHPCLPERDPNLCTLGIFCPSWLLILRYYLFAHLKNQVANIPFICESGNPLLFFSVHSFRGI